MGGVRQQELALPYKTKMTKWQIAHCNEQILAFISFSIIFSLLFSMCYIKAKNIPITCSKCSHSTHVGEISYLYSAGPSTHWWICGWKLFDVLPQIFRSNTYTHTQRRWLCHLWAFCMRICDRRIDHSWWWIILYTIKWMSSYS